MSNAPHLTEAEWRAKLDALLERLRLEGASTRLLLYVDFRRGEVVEGGEWAPRAEKWNP